MGRSRGGLTTKIHALVDANGLPIVKRCSGTTLPGPGAVGEVLGWTGPALRPHWTPTLECL